MRQILRIKCYSKCDAIKIKIEPYLHNRIEKASIAKIFQAFDTACHIVRYIQMSNFIGQNQLNVLIEALSSLSRLLLLFAFLDLIFLILFVIFSAMVLVAFIFGYGKS
jgi:hypothetical protein